MKTSIQLKNIYFSYDENSNQLKDFNLLIPKGECVLLTGGSGCGKTTVTRLINGLIPNYFEGTLKGKICISEKNTSQFEPWEYGRYVGSVFQDSRSQFFTSHVLDELAFASENYGCSSEAIIERINCVMKENKIEYLRNRKLENLSSGEKQKVSMSAVQVHDPDIYVLDEPSANLDHESCLILANLLNELKQEGKTILIADHRIYYLMDIVDRIIYMENGTIKNQWTQSKFKKLSQKYLSSIGIRSSFVIELEDVIENQSNLKTIKNELNESGVLALNDLSISYSVRKNSLMKGIKLTIKKGEIIVLTGKNGIGKTTLAQTICGLLKEKTGEITFNNEKLSKKKRMEKFWFVLQDSDYQLFSDSVINELLLGLKRTQANVERAEKLMKDLDLENLKDQHPASLSGGQKQRVTFAVGLMRQPEYLILDEPTSGLDARNMERMQKLIKEYSKSGVSFIIISHDFEFTLKLGCKTINMDKFRVD
ncbi:ABC transporter ATP-binding protein [Enterococcus casseliflavus]|uniref:ABC transporter ATP-binding protein n=1 Tax=Enterococcus casseliflavus TaxID=37734 RepID=UPI00188384C7|nr:energy-coupling factor ABC transporter ATP-binding protein [Enterococcus casseliflavus]MBE9908889.1 energy-coupling factor ABC transporter ATP-binding protein [Enterococcus casseliflavus]